jgi:hypothetical protein
MAWPKTATPLAPEPHPFAAEIQEHREAAEGALRRAETNDGARFGQIATAHALVALVYHFEGAER